MLLVAGTAAGQHAEFAGSGDDRIAIHKPDRALPALATIHGGAASHPFTVVARDGDEAPIDTLVYATGPYTGTVPIDLGSATVTQSLAVDAEGAWDVRIYPIQAAAGVWERYEGAGDGVLWIEREPRAITVIGNEAGGDFSVVAYNRRGQKIETVVETDEPYEATHSLEPEALLLEIRADGPWSVDVE